MNTKTGFTLIELMIVIAIISILASIAVPSYKKYTQKARFAEVITSALPFKTAVALAIQRGIALNELTNGNHGIDESPEPTKNLKMVHVKNGVITATATALINHLTYILKPDINGTRWEIAGSCLPAGLCDA